MRIEPPEIGAFVGRTMFNRNFRTMNHRDRAVDRRSGREWDGARVWASGFDGLRDWLVRRDCRSGVEPLRCRFPAAPRAGPVDQ
ncbi:hypothetical protein EHYA_00692 [Embleya hyalina]|uniref:Uncharacterized protein n=1 Tax=Embleya hyalina TaxID=516124 RepID=A0A401YEN8_9ACTN|nr:hypothetical protein EHYA_00692 [Embleya hyalina]